MKMKLGMRKEGKKKRTRTSRNAREEVAGKGERDRIITRIKEIGKRKQEIAKEGKKKREG